MNKLLTSVSLACLLAACGGTSTSIQKSWRDPTVSVPESRFNKVLVTAFMKDQTSRRIVEDNMVKRMRGQGVASYTLFGDLEKQDNEAQLRERIKAQGFNGAVVMRLLDVDRETSYVPGTGMFPPFYRGYWPYYWNAWNNFYQPGYYVQDRVYLVETNVYSLESDKLVWSGITRTTNPSSIDKMVNEIADAVGKKMRKEGFLTQ